MADTMPGGYHGKALRVNLSSGAVSVQELDGQFCRKYLGGAGFIAHTLLQEVPASVGPLDPENRLVFAAGPLTGTVIPGAGRHAVGALSPLTEGIAKSEVGEHWGAQFKRSGFDMLIVEGKAARPVYLWVRDGQAEVRDAAHLWGQNTKETQERIRSELEDEKVRVAMIGPGGERMVRYACIMHGPFDAAGRSGLGAVMGSKNLKAVAVRGSRAPAVVDSQGVKALATWLKENAAKVAGLHELGTTPSIPRYEEIGNLPVRNWRDQLFPTVEKISAQAIRDTIRVGMDACYACPVRCKKVVRVTGRYEVDSAYGGPEMETLGALGSDCGIDDLEAVAKGSELCNAYSLDTISTGSTIAFAMECFENGLLTKADTGGIELSFGNAEAMLAVIELIARREGIGDLLAEGSARAAQRIGRGAEALAMHCRKQELPMHSPRVNRAGAVGYAVNPDGADHCANLLDMVYTRYAADPEFVVPEAVSLGYNEPVPLYDLGPKKMSLLRFVRLKRTLNDSLVTCLMIPYSLQQLTAATRAVTGWDTTEVEVLRIAERIMNMCQLFNVRRGFTAKDDTLPARFFGSVSEGGMAGKPPFEPEDFERAKRTYYLLMGWDENAVPRPEKLEELDVSL